MSGSDVLPKKLEQWTGARERFELTDVQVQMARELALNPRKLGARLRQRSGDALRLTAAAWIEEQFRIRFSRDRPETVVSLEERIRTHREHFAEQLKRREARQKKAAAASRLNVPKTEAPDARKSSSSSPTSKPRIGSKTRSTGTLDPSGSVPGRSRPADRSRPGDRSKSADRSKALPRPKLGERPKAPRGPKAWTESRAPRKNSPGADRGPAGRKPGHPRSAKPRTR